MDPIDLLELLTEIKELVWSDDDSDEVIETLRDRLGRIDNLDDAIETDD